MSMLESKVAIVTGASAGIGRAAARSFAREGAKVVITGRRRDALDALVADIERSGGTAAAMAGDVRDEALAAAMVELAVERFGGLDIAFNNAGALGAMGPTPALSLADWQSTLDTNLTSAFLGAKHQVPAMAARGGGSLIFTSSFVGHETGFPDMAAYGASKAGLIGLVRVLAVELGASGIRANALLPGATDTPMGRSVADTDEARAHIAGLNALNRIADPDEVARAALFLASDASSFVTGTALLADGGVSINRA